MQLFTIIVTACSAVYKNRHTAGAGNGVIVFLFLFFGFYNFECTPISPLDVTDLSPVTQSAVREPSKFATSVALCLNIYVNLVALAAVAWK
ncbi:hypothetical protein ASPBRDRAFT_49469 [Aspergillus brasiliensis CBS 101740]|uniref:Amino acid permease/ SLC12A domain-containing protein n=1 Tax=Aspergillus brasiliensis (strain CBS 101740 / IMI 381727 / IBT 21946) TaxID=767769 RepID=A0A1L9U291_ASPBC|nr:hypothetical protein ASPBRDRAFT_49469 [Aspergillus brasiliensis CBS 101740]